MLLCSFRMAEDRSSGSSQPQRQPAGASPSLSPQEHVLADSQMRHDPRWRMQQEGSGEKKDPGRDRRIVVGDEDADDAALTVVRMALSAHSDKPLSPTVYRGLVDALAGGPLASPRLKRHPTVLALRERLSLGFLPESP